MGHIRGKGHHRTTASHSPVRALVVVLVIVAVLVGGGWLVVRHMQAAAPVAKPDKAATVTRVDLDNKQAVPEPVVEHHGNSPDCPDTDCISMLVNGDLLFHPNLWKHFAGANTAATDGTAFDFTPLFETMKPYIQASDIAVCEFETPIAKRGGPYTGYPVFNVPPEVADAAASVGYTACTHATNHSWDQGADGIARLWDTLASKGIAQTGSYKNEEDSTKPLVIDSPTGGGKLSKRDGDKMGFPVFPLFWTSPATGETARASSRLSSVAVTFDGRSTACAKPATPSISPTSTVPSPRPRPPVNRAPTWWPWPCIRCRNTSTTPIRGRSPRRMSSRTPARST